MRADSLEIISLHGIELPDGTTVDSEFLVQARVRVSKMERDLVDVSSMGNPGQTLPGALSVKLVATTKVEVEK